MKKTIRDSSKSRRNSLKTKRMLKYLKSKFKRKKRRILHQKVKMTVATNHLLTPIPAVTLILQLIQEEEREIKRPQIKEDVEGTLHHPPIVVKVIGIKRRNKRHIRFLTRESESIIPSGLTTQLARKILRTIRERDNILRTLCAVSIVELSLLFVINLISP